LAKAGRDVALMTQVQVRKTRPFRQVARILLAWDASCIERPFSIESFQMTNVFRSGLLALFLTVPAASAWPDGTMPLTFELTSAADHARYGLLIASPVELGCGAALFVVRDASGVVGRSQPMLPGQMQVVRIGSFTAGAHALTVAASGCPVQPRMVRRVRLGKPSPDHGWRAAAFVQAQFTP
jgi:hypothetical protein